MPSPPSLAEIPERPDVDRLARMWGEGRDSGLRHPVLDLVAWVRHVEVALADTKAERNAALADADGYRIEADCALRDCDGMDFDRSRAIERAEQLAAGLERIAVGRRNKTLDPWAQEVARETLGASPPVERGAAAGEAQRLRAALEEIARVDRAFLDDALELGAAIASIRATYRVALSSVPLSGGPPAGVTLTAEQALKDEIERVTREQSYGVPEPFEGFVNYVRGLKFALALLRPPAAEGGS